MKHIPKTKDQNFNKCLASRVHKLSCPDCGKVYIGQTGKLLRDIKNTTYLSGVIILLKNIHFYLKTSHILIHGEYFTFC